MFLVRAAIALLLFCVAAHAQTNPGFIDNAILCANYPNTQCSQNSPTNPLSLNQAFANKADYNATTAQSINTTGLTTTFGPGSSLFVWSNPNGMNAAGINAGCRFWVGSNPTATPGASDTVVCTYAIDNLNGRGPTWTSNWICNQYAIANGGTAGIGHCNEVDVTQSIVAPTPMSAFSGGSVMHAHEVECSQNTSGAVFPCQTAFWVSAAGDYANSGTSQTQPWNFAFAASRTQYAGFDCELISGDTGTYFKQGCFWDQSNSATTLLVSGTHTSIIDISGLAGLTQFVNCGAAACSFAGAGGLIAKHYLYADFNANGTYPTAGPGLAAGWNFSGGSAEVDFWNTDTSSPAISFQWRQKTGASSNTLLMSLGPTGGVTTPGLPTSAGSGGLYICVDNAGIQYKKSSCP